LADFSVKMSVQKTGEPSGGGSGTFHNLLSGRILQSSNPVSAFAINEHFYQLEDAVQRLGNVAAARGATC
jgi:hypothetical protein